MDLALLCDCAPQVDHLAIEIHVHLVEVPAPLTEAPHPAHPLAADVACEHRPEPVPSHPHSLVAQVDTALERQFLDVPQRQWKPHIHHHDETDHLGQGVEVAERTGEFAGGAASYGSRLQSPSLPVGAFTLTVPSGSKGVKIPWPEP